MSARKTTEPAAGQAEVLAPCDLLRQIDDWMQAAGHGADHLWRASIAATLKAAAKVKPDTAREVAAENLFGHIASSARDLLELIDDNTDNMPHAGPMRATVAMIGWTADQGLRVHGWNSGTDGAPAWFLLDFQAEAVQAAGGEG